MVYAIGQPSEVANIISFLPPEATNIIDQVPDLLGSYTWFAFQTGHCGAQAVADVDENLPLPGSVIPFVIRQIRSLGFSGRCQLFGFFAIAKTCRAVAFRAQAVVKPLASRQRFWSRGNRVLHGLRIRGRTGVSGRAGCQ